MKGRTEEGFPCIHYPYTFAVVVAVVIAATRVVAVNEAMAFVVVEELELVANEETTVAGEAATVVAVNGMREFVGGA